MKFLSHLSCHENYTVAVIGDPDSVPLYGGRIKNERNCKAVGIIPIQAGIVSPYKHLRCYVETISTKLIKLSDFLYN